MQRTRKIVEKVKTLYRLHTDRFLSRKEVFSRIYKSGVWGNLQEDLFCSGDGSLKENVVEPYLSCIEAQSHDLNFFGCEFVDLGCGDFRVGKKLLHLCSRYHGVDIVTALVEHNQIKYGSPSCKFSCLDIVEDALPDGDVCFVRQVFQHLSNEEILKVLPKLSRYKWVYITEHNISEESRSTANKNKPHGSGIRVNYQSGVFLDEPPFSIPSSQIKRVLSLPQSTPGSRYAEVIDTFLYVPGH
jgi:hypothetical protein